MGWSRSGRAAAFLAGLGLGGLWSGLLPVGAQAAGGERPDAPRGAARVLVLGLDGVPYAVAAAAADSARGEEAILRSFSGPVPMISTFPSTTNVALSGMLEPAGVERSPGYEVRYFDREANDVRGGGPISYHRLTFPWREYFDRTESGLLASMVAHLRPVQASVREVEEALEAFAASDEEVFFAFVSATDGAGHLKGPDVLGEVLAALDGGLRELRRRRPGERFGVILFSDHGQAGDGDALLNVRPAARERLGAAGFRITHRLLGARDVAIPELGMVSSFAVYTRPGREAEVRRVLAATPGVELCVSREGEGFRVEGAGGGARIGRRRALGREEWTYRPDGGDPLGYRPVVDALRLRAGDPDRQWFPDGRWLEATASHRFPDALHRLARAFEVVEHAASVLCSAAPGHMYGAWRTEAASRLTVGPLRWTHGALDAEATLGFFATDLPGWEADGPVRFSEVLAPVARRLEGGRPPATGQVSGWRR